MATFESAFSVGDKVEFYPMAIHSERLMIKREELYGTIVSVKFTAAKVFYSIISDYWGKLFEDVTSENVRVVEKMGDAEYV